MKIKDMSDYLSRFSQNQLCNVILPFWRTYAVDTKSGGFHGQINNDMSVVFEAGKGLILNARILWTFSAVFRNYKNPVDLELARRAYDYLLTFFFDTKFGGYFWSLGPDGLPKETKKQMYAQAFVIYGLSEFYKITADTVALQKAIDVFQLIEEKSFDTSKNGYIEALSREWEELADIRLSEKDMNEKKTMNTHLHILEAYANLYSVWKEPFLKRQLENLIGLFTDKIIDTSDAHQILFFDEDWNPRSTLISFGHDIETSWLLHEAAIISENNELIEKVAWLSIRMCEAVKKGLSPGGALYYESDRMNKHSEKEIEWWAQAEGIVGYLNAYYLSGKKEYLDIAVNLATFIEKYIVDKEHGEWFFRVTEKGTPILTHEKAGFWKCPYHNTRACLEILQRIKTSNT